ncbi:kinase-like protein [Suillus subluteus]|nr:kinase-like protein [Suillus subluteus]
MSLSTDDLFPEEPLTLSGEQGAGFFPARLGMQLNNSRYIILRKLGRGEFSSTWLASDSEAEERLRYCAIKILTVHDTKAHHDGHLLELEVMQTITRSTGISLLPHLRDHFEINGPHGQHLCLVLPALSESVDSFTYSAPSKLLDPPKVKIIVAQVLESLAQLHTANIIHADLKPDNVLFDEGNATQIIQELLVRTPQIVDGEFELNGVHYPIMRSQPIPHPFRWNDRGITVELYSVCLTDFRNAQWTNGKPLTRTTSSYDLRAPEHILGADYDAKVDVWALGCMTFELLTGSSPFLPQRGQTWSIEDEHLAKMAQLTGESFSEKLLARSPKRNEYFDESGKLLRVDQSSPMPLERAMIDCSLPEAEAAAAAAFIHACLHLDPEERFSASDLLHHPWMRSAYTCCQGPD